MEPKKNPKYDVHRRRGIIFNFSLALSLVVVITAFKWAVPYQEKNPRGKLPVENHDFEVVRITYHTKEEKQSTSKPTKPVVVNPTEFKPVLTEIVPVDEPVIEPIIESSLTIDIGLIEPEVKKDSVFILVEKMPEPVGGYPAFYEILSDNMKYPSIARRTHTKGKVFVEFIVDEDGLLQNMHVVKGIGGGCDEEAMRVIKLTKWKAGKQRGRAVKVKMVQPITFDIRN